MASHSDKTGAQLSEKHGAHEEPMVVDTQIGVRKVQALQRVWGTKSKIAIYVAIALARYAALLL